MYYGAYQFAPHHMERRRKSRGPRRARRRPAESSERLRPGRPRVDALSVAGQGSVGRALLSAVPRSSAASSASACVSEQSASDSSTRSAAREVQLRGHRIRHRDDAETRGTCGGHAVRRILDGDAYDRARRPAPSHAARYVSGAGLAGNVALQQERWANRSRRSSRRRWVSTHSYSELEAIAIPKSACLAPRRSTRGSRGARCFEPRAAHLDARADGFASRRRRRRHRRGHGTWRRCRRPPTCRPRRTTLPSWAAHTRGARTRHTTMSHIDVSVSRIKPSKSKTMARIVMPHLRGCRPDRSGWPARRRRRPRRSARSPSATRRARR